MPFRRLKYFVAVAENKSFSRAAAELNIAQSALSRHVFDLEQSIGAALLDRSPKGVHLTPVGRVLFDDARALLAQLGMAYDHARLAAAGSVGKLTVGLNELAVRNPIITGGIVKFLGSHPRVDLKLRAMSSIEQIAGLRDRKMDAGFMIERSTAVGELDHLPVAWDRFLLAVGRSHPLAARKTVSIDDLRGLPFVSIALDRYWLAQSRLLGECRAHGFHLNVALEVDSERLQLALIAEDVGVGFVNESVRHSLPKGIALLKVREIKAGLQLDLVWLRHQKDDLLEEFAACIGNASNGKAPERRVTTPVNKVRIAP
jgi:DNA-binding transcriptional LysR family regulator